MTALAMRQYLDRNQNLVDETVAKKIHMIIMMECGPTVADPRTGKTTPTILKGKNSAKVMLDALPDEVVRNVYNIVRSREIALRKQ